MSLGHEVAILTDDLSTAQAISKTIRLAGVIPHFYENLKSFWFGSIENPPSLLLVDVLQMSQGELVLADHPLVRDHSLAIAFYYTTATSPLLSSTYEIPSLGSVCGDFDLSGQLKVVLDRYNKQVALEQQVRVSSEKQASLLTQIEEAQRAEQRAMLRDEGQVQLLTLCQKFHQKNKSFFDLCEKVFSQSSCIARYALVELAPGQQRVVTHKADDKKIVHFEPIWLGKKCSNGIELFAQNLITQVAMESFSKDLVILSIAANKGNPDKLVFIEPASTVPSSFDWDFLESHLSGVYAQIELIGEREGMMANRHLDSWQMLEVIDQEFFSATGDQGKLKIVDLDFSNLLSTIRTRPDTRFFWDRFIEEFKLRLSLSLDCDYQLSSFGPKHMAIACINPGQFWFEGIKQFVDGFPFWRYFENAQNIMGVELCPQVRMIPSSAEAYLSFLDHREVLYTKHSGVSEPRNNQPVPSRVQKWSESRITL